MIIRYCANFQIGCLVFAHKFFQIEYNKSAFFRLIVTLQSLEQFL